MSNEYLKTCDEELELILGKQVEIITYQSEQIPYEDIKILDNKVSGMQGKIQNQLNAMQADQEAKANQISKMESEMDSLKQVDLLNIYKEVKTVFPNLNEIAIANDVVKSNFANTSKSPIALLKWNEDKKGKVSQSEIEKLTNFIKLRAKLDTIVLIQY